MLFSILALTATVRAAIHAAKTRRQRMRLRDSFGKAPDVSYFDGDLDRIRIYYDLFRSDDVFSIDEITWNDLSLDDIFKQINSAQTISGEQYLYNLLRTPVFEKAEYEERLSLIDKMADNESLRLRIQMQLQRLGRHRSVKLYDTPDSGGRARILLYILLDLILAGSVLMTVFLSFQFALLIFSALVGISFIYSNSDYNISSFNYIFKMVHVVKIISKYPEPSLKTDAVGLDCALKKLSWLGKIGAIRMLPSVEVISDALSMLLLIDLITFELSKNKLSACFEELMAVNDFLGRLDSSIAIASYRAGPRVWCRPEVDFNYSGKGYLKLGNITHPLIKQPVPSSFETGSAMLLTGSNASGKSTFLKAAALGAVFAQSLCLCLATDYKAPPYRVYSSMALRDDIKSGESYYIVEIKSIKRIIDAAQSVPLALCIVDEVLRGTNTIERIAASSEVLLHLGKSSCLCIAATHDVELCGLLGGVFDSYHFQESIEGDRMTFDYRLYKGASTSRNAIRLLETMGYDKALVQGALKRAEGFSNSGNWEK